MEGMFNDIKLNSDISVDFKERAKTVSVLFSFKTHALTKLPFEFSTKVLTSTFWPISSKQDNILLPEDFAACMQTFTKFYDKRHNGRKLTWLVSMVSLFKFDDCMTRSIGFH